MHIGKKKKMYTEITQLIHKYFCILNSKYEGEKTTIKIDDNEYYNLQAIHTEDEKFKPSNVGFLAEVDDTKHSDYIDYTCFWCFPHREFNPNSKFHDLDHWSAVFEFKFLETSGYATTHYLYYNIVLSSLDYLIFTVCREVGNRSQNFTSIEDIDIDTIPVIETNYTLSASPEMIKEFHEEYFKIIDKYKK